MNKRFIVSLFLLLVGCFSALTVLGRQMVPKAPVTVAWLAPFGNPGYLKAIQGTVPIDSSREEVEDILGEAHSVMRSRIGGSFSLLYEIPNSVKKSEVVIFFGESQKVKQIVLLQ